MFPLHNGAPDGTKNTLKDAVLGWARAALLAVPLTGCATQSSELTTDRPPFSSRETGALPQRFLPPEGCALTGLEYREGSVQPLFSAVADGDEPFSPAEMTRLHQLLSPDGALRFVAVCELLEEYHPRLEPAIVQVLLHDHDGGIAGRATRLLRERGGSDAVAILCREIQVVCGDDLERCVSILREHPNQAVAQALAAAIRTSGFGEKEARDEGMVLGKALVMLSPQGDKLIRDLLTDNAPTMQMAAAISLASLRDKAALPTLLRYSVGDDYNLRREAIAALVEYPAHPEILPPLERALKEIDHSYTALVALKEVGYPALHVLAPYADPEFFKASGVERQGHNPYLPGISYGELVVALTRCHELRPADASRESHEILERMSLGGIRKLIEDLDYEQLRPGAHEGLLALGHRVYPYLPALLTKRHGKGVLLSYPVETLAIEFAPFLVPEGTSPLTLEACSILAHTIRRPSASPTRTAALESVVRLYPEAPWLRHLVSSVWREDCDATWTTAALAGGEPSPNVCAIREEVEAASALGIDVPLRWSRENLAEIIRNRTATNFDGRPIATIIYAEADYNGAFGEHNAAITALTRNGYCVMYYDESTDLGVVRALKDSVIRPQEAQIQPAALIIFGAHSSQSEMVFGRASTEEAKLSLDDKDLLSREVVDKSLDAGGQIVLIACSAGEGRNTQKNIANMVREIFSQAKKEGIWSTEVPDNIGEITFDPTTKELREVRFLRGQVYRP